MRKTAKQIGTLSQMIHHYETFQQELLLKHLQMYPASRVGLQQSPSSTFPSFYISINCLCKPTLPGFDTSFEVPRLETWTGLQTSITL